MNSARRDELLRRLAEVLVCPQCRAPIDLPADGELQCPSCGYRAVRRSGQLSFGEYDCGEPDDWLDRLKGRAKRRLGPFYPLAIRLISPVQGLYLVGPFVDQFDTDRDLLADLGSGPTEYDERVVCVDGVAYPSVHVVGDLERLPFRADSLSGVISVGVLEHVRDPAAHVAEMRRVLRPGGRVLCFIPFMQGYHASPHDYWRFTASGLRELFAKEFEVLDVKVQAGPTSSLVWILQEWLALVLSLGSRRLYRMLLPTMWVLSPIKLLDLALAHHPEAHVVASVHVIEARKE